MSTITREERLDIFINKLIRAMEEFYGDEVKVRVLTCNKNNGIILRGISIILPGENVTPNLYVDDMFEEYENGRLFADIVKDIIRLRERFRVSGAVDVEFFNHYEQVRDKLGIRLINKDMNKKLLDETPHRIYLDMAIVYVVYVRNKDLGDGTILIRHEHCEPWKVSEEQLYRDALENMQRINPPVLMGIDDMLKSVTPIYDRETYHMDPKTLECVNRYMMVLTNESRISGASTIVYPGMLRRIYEQIGGDYYLLPSSIHELIIINCSESEAAPAHLTQMVREVNSYHLEPVEILSNNAYRYNAESDELIILEEATSLAS